jgi:hypothetical protein
MKVLDEPLASFDGDTLHFFPTGQSKPYLGTRADAERLMRQLDADLHPWREPGMPETVGAWHMQTRKSINHPWGHEQPVVSTGVLPGSLARSSISVTGIGWQWSGFAVDDYPSGCVRFRPRWIPETAD